MELGTRPRAKRVVACRWRGTLAPIIDRWWRRFLMNKIDIVTQLSEQINLNQKIAKVVVDTIIDAIKTAIINGERVEIRGFGSFSLRSYKPYKGRNPKNGEIVEVPEKKLPYFKVGKELKETIWKER
jgi:integration host factor subunit beta